MTYEQQKKFKLGSECIITLVHDDNNLFIATFNKLWGEVTNFENKYSRFIESSELSKINLNSGKRIKVSHESIDILKLCKEYYYLTNGAFNPFILPLLQRDGYKGSWPDPEKFNKKLDFSNRKIKDIENLVIEKDAVLIPKDSALDLGGIGKGYLLNKLTKTLGNKFKGFYISLGGDLVTYGVDPSNQPWKIYISSSYDNGKNISYVLPSPKLTSVATSGVTKRSKKNWNHLINTKTLKSIKNEILSVSVVANNPILADVTASSIIVMEEDEARDIVKKCKIDVIIQKERKSEKTYNIEYLGKRDTFNP